MKKIRKNCQTYHLWQHQINDLPTYDELYDAFKELHNDMMKIIKKNARLKKKILELSKENDALHKCNDLLNEKIKELELDNEILHYRIASLKGKQNISYDEKSNVDNLIKKNEELTKKSNKLNEIMLKFTNGQKNLEKLLNSKKCVFDKGGVGYKLNLKQKYYKNYFVKATSTIDHKIICHYYNTNGHMNYRCPVKRMRVMESNVFGSKRNHY